MARHVVCELEDVASSESLEPDGRRTPDWRLELHTGETVDLEVTRATDGEARSFRSQLVDRQGKAKEWADPRLKHDWIVAISATSPVREALRAKEVVEAIINVLAEAERHSGHLGNMAQVARSRFIYPEQFFHNTEWQSSWSRSIRAKVGWEAWLLNHSGYWLPKLLLEGAQDRHGDCRVLVFADPTPASGRTGRVRTHFSGSEGSAGHEALLTAIQDSIDHNAAKGQMDNSPGLKWLAVVVEGIAAWDLRENTESGSLEPGLAAGLKQIDFRCFDEVLVLTRGIVDHGVLRLSTSASPRCTLIPTSQAEDRSGP